MTKNTLHWLITVDVVLALVLVGLEISPWRLLGLEASLAEWVERRSDTEITPSESVFAVVGSLLFFLQIFAWVWLWKLKPYARELYAASYLLMVFLSGLGGAYVTSGWMLAIESLATLVIGVIIGGLYLAPPVPEPSQNSQA